MASDFLWKKCIAKSIIEYFHVFPLSKIFDRKLFIVAVPFTFYNFDARYANTYVLFYLLGNKVFSFLVIFYSYLTPMPN